MVTQGNVVLNKLFHMFGAEEMNDLSDAYDVNVENSFLNVRAILCNSYSNLAWINYYRYVIA